MAQSNTRQRASASTGQYRHVCEGGAVNAIRVSSGLFLLGVACVSGPDPDETGFVSGTWSTVQSIPEPVQEIHAAVLHGHIYIAGGLDATNSPTTSAYRFDPVADDWERLADLPAASLARSIQDLPT